MPSKIHSSAFLKHGFFFVVLSLFAISEINAQSWAWEKSLGGTANDYSNSIATDKAGNIYVTGAFASTSIKFGTITLNKSVSATKDIFIAKYDPSGNAIWAKGITCNNDNDVTGIAVDTACNVFITGQFSGTTMQFGGVTLVNTGFTDIFIAKFDSAGAAIWAKGATGTDGNDYTAAIATDAAGNVFVTGYFESTHLVFGSYTLVYTDTGAGYYADVFTAKFSPSGTPLWAKRAAGSMIETPTCLGTDLSGNVYVCGNTGSPDFSAGTITLTGSGTDMDIFILKYNSTGALQWAKRESGTGNDIPYALATDDSNHVYITARSTANVTIGSDTLSGVILAKYDDGGNAIWARKVADAAYVPWALTKDTSGNIYLAGTFEKNTINFDGLILTNDTTYLNEDAFVAKYNSNGSVAWAIGAGGNSYDEPKSIAVSTSGSVYIAGVFGSDTLKFGGIKLGNSSATSTNGFIAKIYQPALSVSKPGSIIDQLVIYPNPNTGKITANFKEGKYNSIYVYDRVGHLIYNKALSPNDKSLEIDLQKCPDGIYYLSASGENQSKTLPFIVYH